jgi:hypothetical protein
MQLLTTLTTAVGDLLTLAAAVTNLAAALAQRHPRTTRPRQPHLDASQARTPDKPATT